jgi:hypothetical protein
MTQQTIEAVRRAQAQQQSDAHFPSSPAFPAMAGRR